MDQPATISAGQPQRGATQLALAAAAVVALVLMFQDTFTYLFGIWQREEYSHGFLIPLISAYLIWQRRTQLAQTPIRSSWAGVVVAVAGVAIYFLGMLASITTIDTYALVIVLLGAALALLGWPAFRIVLVPLALLFLMNPIPSFFYNNLSSALQLISSQLGVAFMRVCGVSVFLEGNVIDLGNYKLQVAEACSGLRYLFPLMTLGVIVAYLFRGPVWTRWCLFLSTVPIAVLMNSLRIGIIGVLVDRLGIGQAEGFLHFFEGWVVFMICFLLLIAEGWLLMRLLGQKRALRDLFAWQLPSAGGPLRVRRAFEFGKPALVVLAILMVAAWPARALPKRIETPPERSDFASFPLQFDTWHGRREQLDAVYLDTLKLDDYVMADYVQSAGAGDVGASAMPVNLYVAYYASQRTGQSAHSPRSCLPGGGWRILESREFPVNGLGGSALRVNRVIVEKGTERQLIYYWFQERGRDLTNEYLVKWYLLKDALLRNRSDGALVRVITPLAEGEPAAAADARLSKFLASALPNLSGYLPN